VHNESEVPCSGLNRQNQTPSDLGAESHGS